ncbi:hypothetical protein HYT56_04615 [Candidatus Woesearchaeota archaeon]|nr:hypothetical protein [Candidatus Woesearchaeota archaeon]
MKKKRYVILFIIVSLFLIVGQSCERKDEKTGVFLGGKDGLSVGFVDDAPPISGIFQNEAFPIDVELINKGETEIGEGAAVIYLTGALFSSGAVQTEKQQESNDAFISFLEESEQARVEDSLVVPLGKATYKGTILGDSVPLDVRAAVCYPYETRVQVDDFCIPSTSRQATGQNDCEIVSTTNIIKENDNSGAPVHVTSLREQEGPDFVRVTLDINNVGTGDVINPGTCKRDLQREDLDKVKVKMPGNFACTFRDGESNEGIVELRSGHAVLRCKRNVNNPGSAFKETIGITLSYNYQREVSKTVTVNKAT